MAAGLTDRVWEISEIVALMDEGRAARAREHSEQADWYGPNERAKNISGRGSNRGTPNE
jgi:hypothetical protein